MSKTIVLYCIRAITLIAVWAVAVKTYAVFKWGATDISDVLVNESRHTVMVLNDGPKAEQIDEKHEANKAKVKARFGFDDKTITWLDTYKYNEALFEKLATKP